jgi:hypothetical protein
MSPTIEILFYGPRKYRFLSFSQPSAAKSRNSRNVASGRRRPRPCTKQHQSAGRCEAFEFAVSQCENAGVNFARCQGDSYDFVAGRHGTAGRTFQGNDGLNCADPV